MDIQAEKLWLIEQLLQTDDVKVLSEVKAILNPIVKYEPDGTPITRQDLIRKIDMENLILYKEIIEPLKNSRKNKIGKKP